MSDHSLPDANAVGKVIDESESDTSHGVDVASRSCVVGGGHPDECNADSTAKSARGGPGEKGERPPGTHERSDGRSDRVLDGPDGDPRWSLTTKRSNDPAMHQCDRRTRDSGKRPARHNSSSDKPERDRGRRPRRRCRVPMPSRQRCR